MVYEDNIEKKPYGMAIVIKKDSSIWSAKDLKELTMNYDFITRRYNIVDIDSENSFFRRFAGDIRTGHLLSVVG